MPRWLKGWLASLIAALVWLSASSQAAKPPLSVPILLYHRLGPAVTDDMTVTTPVVEGQLKDIQAGGYSVIPLKTLLADLTRLTQPATPPPHPAALIVSPHP